MVIRSFTDVTSACVAMKKLISIFRFSILAVMISLVAACSSGDDNSAQDNSGNTGQASTIVGVTGGALLSTDGRLSLEFPAGALPSDINISIEKLDADNPPANLAGLGVKFIYRLSPDGISFPQDKPVKVTFKLPPGMMQANQLMVLASASGSTIEALQRQSMEVNADTEEIVVSGYLQHFSEVAGVLEDGLTWSISGVPSTLPVGEEFIAQLTIDQTAESAMTADAVVFRDDTEMPLEFLKPLASLGPLFLNQAQTLSAELPYRCAKAGIDWNIGDIELSNIVFGLDRNPTIKYPLKYRAIVVCHSLVDRTNPEANQLTIPVTDIGHLKFSSKPAQVKADVGEAFKLTVHSDGTGVVDVGIEHLARRFRGANIVDTNPGVVSAARLTGVVPDGLEFDFDSNGQVSIFNYKVFDGDDFEYFAIDASLNGNEYKQELTFSCLKQGTTFLAVDIEWYKGALSIAPDTEHTYFDTEVICDNPPATHPGSKYRVTLNQDFPVDNYLPVDIGEKTNKALWNPLSELDNPHFVVHQALSFVDAGGTCATVNSSSINPIRTRVVVDFSAAGEGCEIFDATYQGQIDLEVEGVIVDNDLIASFPELEPVKAVMDYHSRAALAQSNIFGRRGIIEITGSGDQRTVNVDYVRSSSSATLVIAEVTSGEYTAVFDPGTNTIEVSGSLFNDELIYSDITAQGPWKLDDILCTETCPFSDSESGSSTVDLTQVGFIQDGANPDRPAASGEVVFAGLGTMTILPSANQLLFAEIIKNGVPQGDAFIGIIMPQFISTTLFGDVQGGPIEP